MISSGRPAPASRKQSGPHASKRAYREERASKVAQGLIAGGMSGRDVYRRSFWLPSSPALGGRLLHVVGERRNWSGFADEAHRRAQRNADRYANFAKEHGITRVVLATVHPADAIIPIVTLRSSHAKLSSILSTIIRRLREKAGIAFACDMVAIEVVPITASGDRVALHAHLVIRANRRRVPPRRVVLRQEGVCLVG